MDDNFDIDQRIADVEEEVAKEMLIVDRVSGPANQSNQSKCHFRGGKLPELDGNWDKTKEDVSKLMDDAKQDALKCLEEANAKAKETVDKTADEAKKLVDDAKKAVKK